MHLFSYFDLILAFFYSIIIIVWASNYAMKKKDENPAYKYYVKAIVAKIIGAIALSSIYLFYYGGGDTIDYMETIISLNNLIENNFSQGFKLLFSAEPNGRIEYSYFVEKTGYPAIHIFIDPKSYAVVRFISPIAFLAFNNFISTAVLLSVISFWGVWRMFLLLVKQYPRADKELTYSVLFIPSVLFWGSGIMKDTLTFSATCWFVVAFHSLFMERKQLLLNFVYLIIAIFVLISIKPYILYSLIPGSFVWLSFNKIKSIKNSLLRFLVTPFILFLSLLGSNFMLSQMSDSMGKFSMDNAVSQAQIIQQDLKRDAYGSNSFDIGEFDGSLSSMLSKAPIAINAALFRPYLIEARNPVMILSALENTLLLFLTLSLLLKVGVFKIIRYMKADPYLVFAFLFTVVFAFMVGLSTSNFGALVRYKIPLLPFFISFLFICRMYYKIELAGQFYWKRSDT